MHTFKIMMPSSNGNIFRVTGLLCGEFTGHQWIPHSKASDAELWFFVWSAPDDKRLRKQSWGWWFETPSYSLWRHCNFRKRKVLQSENKVTGGTRTILGLGHETPVCIVCLPMSLQWRHNGRDGVSNHQHHDCLLNRLFGCRTKKTSKPRLTGLCAGNSPGTGEFPAQMASNAESVSIWWRPHVLGMVWTIGTLNCYTVLARW